MRNSIYRDSSIQSSSVRIESIALDSRGFKIIAFSKVLNFKGVKPWVSPVTLCDYKDGVLRIFESNRYESYTVGTFKNCIHFLRKL